MSPQNRSITIHLYSLVVTKNAPPNWGTTFLFYPSSLSFSQANAAKLAHTKMNVARALAQAALGGRRPWALVPSRSLTLRLSKAGAANRGLMHMSSRFWQKRPYILAKILTSFFCSLFDGHFNWQSFWLFCIRSFRSDIFCDLPLDFQLTIYLIHYMKWSHAIWHKKLTFKLTMHLPFDLT